MKCALIAGASGLIGNELLQLMLSGNEYEKILVLIRKPLELNHPKLIQQQVDFSQILSLVPSIAVDDVFCTLGTTFRKAGSQEAFRQVDYDYVVGLGKFCETNRIQHFLVVSAMGANTSSGIFYNRVKGEMEKKIDNLSIPSISVFRPSLLLGNRKEIRKGERFAQIIMVSLAFLFIGGLKKFKPIQAKTLARAMIQTAGSKSRGFKVLHSGQIEELGNRKP